MDFFSPYDQLGLANPGPWQNASPQAGQKGSIVNALVFPAVMNEILNVQDEAGLTRDSSNAAQLLQAIRSGKLTFFPDTGTADALVITPRTSFPNLGTGLELAIWKNPQVGANATTTPQLTAGASSMTFVKEDGSALAPGDLPAGSIFTARSDGTSLRVQGQRRSDTSQQVATTISGTEGVKTVGTQASLNYPGLLPEETLNPNDIMAFFAEEAEGGQPAGHHYSVTISSLAATISSLIGQGSNGSNGGTGATGGSGTGSGQLPAFPNIIQSSQSGTYTPTPGARMAEVYITGAGGGGGGTSDDGAAAGGSAGATAILTINLAGITSIPYTIGSGGAGGAAGSGPSACGGTGGNSTFGSYVTAGGGGGSKPGGGSVYRATTPLPGGVVTPGSTPCISLTPIPGGTGSTSTVPDGDDTGSSGGASYWGGGGAGGYYNPYSNACAGQEAHAPGSGGGGASAALGYAAAGGAGAGGFIRIREYF